MNAFTWTEVGAATQHFRTHSRASGWTPLSKFLNPPLIKLIMLWSCGYILHNKNNTGAWKLLLYSWANYHACKTCTWNLTIFDIRRSAVEENHIKHHHSTVPGTRQVSITAQSTIVHGQFCWEVRGIEGMADTAYSLVEARGMERWGATHKMESTVQGWVSHQIVCF